MAKRTTVTLDNQVMNAVKARAVKKGITFQKMLNEILRKWLNSSEDKKPKKIKITSISMGKPRVNISDRDSLYDVMERK